MNIDVGPYVFSLTDARRTLHHVDDLIGFLPDAAQPSLAGLRSELAAEVESVDTDDADAVAATVKSIYPRILAARDIVVADGGLPAPATGAVAQINVSDGGVPKKPVQSVDIDWSGVTTDRQATRVHHGRPWQAVCLWGSEVIDSLAADGHPIYAGAAGENITVSGIDWAQMVVGSELRVGTALLRIMSPAVPCQQNAQWFSDGSFDRIHHRHGPVSRLYAAVLEPGRVSTADEVVLEPS